MFTFDTAAAHHRKFVEFYETGKLAVALCHGVAILKHARRSSGDHPAKGKTVTGFANVEEDFADNAVWEMNLLSRDEPTDGSLLVCCSQPLRDIVTRHQVLRGRPGEPGRLEEAAARRRGIQCRQGKEQGKAGWNECKVGESIRGAAEGREGRREARARGHSRCQAEGITITSASRSVVRLSGERSSWLTSANG
jgi:hypothetical protein